MFKKIFSQLRGWHWFVGEAGAGADPVLAHNGDLFQAKVKAPLSRPVLSQLSWLLLLSLSACATMPKLPRMNLAAPGWKVRQGQAVWNVGHGKPDIAGDLIVATRSDGQAFVQFSKTPLSLAVAEKTAQAWQVEFPIQNKRYAGHGKPPSRLIWLLLPGVLSGKPPPAPWSWHESKSGNWRLANPKTGESLEGYFAS